MTTGRTGRGREGAVLQNQVACGESVCRKLLSFCVVTDAFEQWFKPRPGKEYRHTLREIRQQPLTWPDSAARAVAAREIYRASLEGMRAVVLTGSGSSLYAGECLDPWLQSALGLPARSVAAGDFLTQGTRVLPGRPALTVSLARSGDSPESTAAVDALLAAEPDSRHLVITCNAEGKLATRYGEDGRVRALVLDDAVCDRSLVMTSSFTNMVVAGSFLGALDDPAGYTARVARLARIAETVLAERTQALAEMAARPFRAAVYLGGGCRFGAARESALKMVESTAGRVRTFPETFLGLRHGPMSAVQADTLVVCFLDAEPVARAYELDLIEELNRKNLGMGRVIVGADAPRELLREGDVVVSHDEMAAAGDDFLPVIDVLAAQLLAFFRSLAEGLSPDAPSESGVISRVVPGFRLHGAARGTA